MTGKAIFFVIVLGVLFYLATANHRSTDANVFLAAEIVIFALDPER
jgi:hypothetical protein